MLAVAFAAMLGGLAATAGAAGPPSTVERFSEEYELAFGEQTVIRGERSGLDGCSFKLPPLVKKPGGPPIVRRPVQVDYADCTAILERGTPPPDVIARFRSEDGDSTQEAMSSADPAGPVAASPRDLARVSGKAKGRKLQVTNRTVRYKVEWHDPPHFVVNSLRANLTYSTSGGCVVNTSGSSTDFYLIPSGWTRVYRDTFISPTVCSYRKVWANAAYRNAVFCSFSGTTVRVDYNQVWVQATTSAEVGRVEATWETESGGSVAVCPNLHYIEYFD